MPSRHRDPSLYESDVLTWAGEQSGALARLEAGDIGPDVDWPNVIRTIEDVGREELGRVREAVAAVLGNAQRGYLDPDSHSRIRWSLGSARHACTIQRYAVPSIRRRIDLDRLWVEVFDAAAAEVAPDLICGIPPGLPARCPFSWADLLDEAFTYETAVRRLYDRLKAPAEDATP